MRNKIFDKIWDLQTKQPTINKLFPFSLEDLQQDPEGCLEVIESYLERHKDKIEDFFFESWMDEVSFTPILMMKMVPVPEIARHLFSSNLLNVLLPSSKESEILRERITNILSKYAFEFNEQEYRKGIISDLQFIFPEVEIIDKTAPENIDKGILNFIVKIDDNEMTLEDYLDLIASKKRYE